MRASRACTTVAATVLLTALPACGMGSFETKDGKEPVRAALYFAPDSTLTLAAQGSRQIYVLLANSTMPCWPEEVEDDPRTQTDESQATQSYWEAQFGTAFTREGAIAIAMVLSLAPEEDWLGRYPLQADAWDMDTMAAYVEEDGRVAAGGWYHVEEASVGDANGVLYGDEGGITVEEEEHDLTVGAPGWVELATKDTSLTGTFDFSPAPLGGSFEASRCDNTDLLTKLYQQLAVFVLADQIEDDTPRGDTGFSFEE